MPKPRSDDAHRYLQALFDTGTVAGLADGELLDRFVAGRGEAAELAFAALVARHGPMVLRVSRNLLRDAHDAEDAFQATFLVLARSAGSVRRRDTLGPYLHGIALRVAACARATKARQLRHERRRAELVPSALVVPEVDDSARVVHEELGRLPDRFQGVAVLCDLEGKTYAEAARLLGCPIGTVMSRLSEARRRLRRSLARRGLAPAGGAIATVFAEEAGATTTVVPSALSEATVQAATGVVVSSAVLTLTRGVIKLMRLTRVKTLGTGLLTAVGLMAMGFAVFAGLAHDGEQPAGKDAPPFVPSVDKPARAVSVLVRDARGRAVPQAAVECLGNDDSLARATSDAEGIARFPIPADAQVMWVLALKAGMGLDYFENYTSWPTTRVQPLPATVTLVLGKAQTVRVKLIGSDDRPVAGIEVATWGFQKKGKIAATNLSGATLAQVKTDAAGIATFDFVPDDLEGGYSFLGASGEYDFTRQVWYDPAAGQTELTVRVLRSTRVSGKVTLPDGKPAEGILIRAEGHQGGSFTYCRRDDRSAADGSYSLEVDPGQVYIVAVLDESWAAPSHFGIAVHEGKPHEGLDFHLGKGTLIRGRVSTAADHKPAAHQTVTVIAQKSRNATPSLVRWATTDNDGRYAIRVGPGPYTIYGPRESKQVELKVADEATIEHDIEVTTTPSSMLTGIVQAGGEPLANALVNGDLVHFPHTGFEVTTNGAGRFEANRRRDPLIVYARNSGGTLAGLVLVAANDEAVTIHANPAAKASGRVVDRAGKPRSGVQIQCALLKGSVHARDVPLGVVPPQIVNTFARTDSQGRFSFTGLVVGEGVLLSAGDPMANLRETVNQNFDVTGTDPIELPDLVLDPPPP